MMYLDQLVARMVRSEIRDSPSVIRGSPDCAALHPGYKNGAPIYITESVTGTVLVADIGVLEERT